MISRPPKEINLPLGKLGVTQDQFIHPSAVHGEGHVNRVIFNAMTLCRSMGWGHVMPECWAAAYLHDLSRRHDGVCHDHGRWAVEEQFDKYIPLFKQAGVKRFDLVCEAVEVHSLMEEAPANPVCQVLKDADALDRCRLGDLDPRFLRLERSHMLINKAERLFGKTCSMPSWLDVWECGVTIYNPHLGCAKVIPMFWDETETGPQRMMRRLGCSKTGMGVLHRFASAANNHEINGELVTYASNATLQKIRKSGVFLSFWELEPSASWHGKYTDNPDDARAYTEERLFGERCKYMVHGILRTPLIPVETQDEADRVMRRNYGELRIHLSPDLIQSCSFTIEDSQSCGLALPLNSRALKAAMGACFRPPRYIEVQIHQKVEAKHITDVQ